MKYYVLRIPCFTQYKYAWYETTGKAIYSDALLCPKCNAAVSLMYWEPPYEVVIKQPRNIGDFICGAGGSDLLVTKNTIDLFNKNKIKGIIKCFQINIIRMGTTKKAKQYKKPNLFGIYFVHDQNTRVDYNKMDVVWQSKPKKNYCRFCGPGGGGRKGVALSIQRIVFEKESNPQNDIFYAYNFPGRIIISEKLASLIIENELTNYQLIAFENYKGL